MPPFRQLLWVDSAAGVLAGVAVLALSGWLSELYALPRALLVGMGAANVAYGAFSGSLARRSHRPRRLIALLVAANATWAALCGLAAVALSRTASPFGMAHLVAEGMFVGGLAAVEWRARARLVRAG